MKIDNRVVVVGDKINFKQGTELEGKILKINQDTLEISGGYKVPLSKCYLGQSPTLTEKKERAKKLKNVPTAIINGKKVTIGDEIYFKCDVEQSGELKEIKNTKEGVVLVLVNEDGFSGGYIGGDTETEMEVDHCWFIG